MLNYQGIRGVFGGYHQLSFLSIELGLQPIGIINQTPCALCKGRLLSNIRLSLSAFLSIAFCSFNRGVTAYQTKLSELQQLKLTRPARGATLRLGGFGSSLYISTHTPREGRDMRSPCSVYILCISTHTPREGRDRLCRQKSKKKLKFQLTRPARGATYQT